MLASLSFYLERLRTPRTANGKVDSPEDAPNKHLPGPGRRLLREWPLLLGPFLGALLVCTLGPAYLSNYAGASGFLGGALVGLLIGAGLSQGLGHRR
jgi:hypothetical protein